MLRDGTDLPLRLAVVATVALGLALWLRAGTGLDLDTVLIVGLRHVAQGDGPVRTAWQELMLAATALGAFPTLCLIVIATARLLVRMGRRADAVRFVLQSGAGIVVANLLKHLVDRPRPTLVAHWTSVSSSSFPSGHSADAAVVYFLAAGIVVEHVGRSIGGRYVERAALALVVLVGCSRVYLGVHWPTDVLGGWAVGSLWAHGCRALPTIARSRSFGRAQTFANVVVHPTQALLKPPFMLFRGGPDWPSFWLRVQARHCRFAVPVPLDVRPRPAAAASGCESADGIWCGPVSQHFGHAIATFGSRIPASIRLDPHAPLVFSAFPGEQPPVFFWQILARFGVPRERVRIVSTPTMFGRLHVVPQAERILGGAPDESYLALLDELNGPPPPHNDSRLYVSRADMWKGKIAGELYLEGVLDALGYTAFRPETFSVEEQLDAYRRASHLVFAEGSALHALQLLGKVSAEVTVIVRRNRARLAQIALRPRVARLGYIDAARGLLHGLRGDGRPQPSAGITLVDVPGLLSGLEEVGVPISSVWDQQAFLARERLDLEVWIDARLRHPLHRNEGEAIRRSLRRLGIDHPIREVVAARAFERTEVVLRGAR